MSERENSDIRIAGSGMVATGAYRKVSVSGSATLSGDIECESLKISGSTDGRGNLKAGEIKVNGTMHLDGDVSSGDLTVNGSAYLDGNLKATNVRIAGSVKVQGDVALETAVVRGSLDVSGDCEAERFEGHGGFDVGGLLNAGVVDIQLYGPCSAREIGGEAIAVRAHGSPIRKIVDKLWPSYLSRLTVDTIEGDEVRLEHTVAKIVRANTVVIGTGCEIGLVEYATALEQAPDAKVADSRKTGAAE